MTLWQENFLRIIAKIEGQMPASFLNMSEVEVLQHGYAAHLLVNDLIKAEDGRYTRQGETLRLRLAGLEVTSTENDCRLLQNWLLAARKPTASAKFEDMRSALQWLLDDMYDANETHNIDSTIFDSVENATAALVEAGGNLNWYSQDDAKAYRIAEKLLLAAERAASNG